jgi:hypothetical protein
MYNVIEVFHKVECRRSRAGQPTAPRLTWLATLSHCFRVPNTALSLGELPLGQGDATRLRCPQADRLAALARRSGGMALY